MPNIRNNFFPMNVSEAEQYLIRLSKLNRKEFMKDPAHCDVYIKRMQFFLDILGNPEKKIPHYIHVTGTSGKGSVTNMLDSVLRASGKKVGATISPQTTYITDRWRVQGKTMTDKEFISLTMRMKEALDIYIRTSPYDAISFFEITTAITLLYFAEKKVEWAIVEVGCGGRFDATNVIPQKDIAIITSIGLDHTEIIGDTKEKIAYEKAGIISAGCHLFTQEKNTAIRNILYKEADGKKVNSTYIPTNAAKHISLDWRGTTFAFDTLKLSLPCIGIHQAHNAALVASVARHLGISDEDITQGLASVQQPIRCEVVCVRPYTIIDSAHNDDKIKSTVRTILSLPIKKTTKIHLLVGMTHGKTVQSMMRELSKIKPIRIACTRQTLTDLRIPENPASLALLAKKYMKGTEVETFIDPYDALAWIQKGLKKDDILLITGSGFISGELRPRLTN